MGDLIDINELRKEFAEKLTTEEWQKFAEMQRVLIDKYEKRISLLSEKNQQLEKLLMSRTPDLITELTPEENICIQQIDRLEKLSNERQLTLEEVKRLDLLVKNLKLIREESTIVVNNRPPAKLEEKDLVAIVRAEIESSDTERG